MSDRVAVMHRGRIEQLAPPQEIYDAPATPFVADFIGETNFVELNGRTVALRPERLRVTKGDPRGTGGGLAGEIVTTMVVGPSVQWLVRADDGQELLVREQRTELEGEEAVEAGDRVVVSWADDAALEVAGGEGGRTA
jgi:putative spermidine/putrescine transport system ATP-binding protein